MDEDNQSIGQIAVPCGRLSCKKPVIQELGPGRRKEYCSDTCRRGADRDYKRAKAHVDTFEEYLRRSQHEVASYGRKAEADALSPEQLAGFETSARVAFTRAETLVEVGVPADLAVVELATLVQALRPLMTARVGFSARSA
ncbi:MAG: hypothetical protein Q7J48_03795 [Nocardioides sp.]|nr:hypothetical protein [Nocardioides sp.]